MLLSSSPSALLIKDVLPAPVFPTMATRIGLFDMLCWMQKIVKSQSKLKSKVKQDINSDFGNVTKVIGLSAYILNRTTSYDYLGSQKTCALSPLR